jgi:mannose-6-phosphate isomerase-like protein (cupin superfamily)
MTTERVDPQVQDVEKRWAKRGFGCEMREHEPGEVAPDGLHDADELIAVIGGAAEVEICGEKKQLARGDEVLVPEGVSRQLRCVGPDPLVWLQGCRGDAPHTD